MSHIRISPYQAFAVLLVFLFAFPAVALAQAPIFEAVCTGPDCNFCHLFVLLHRIINFLLFTLALPVVALLFAWAGILYITAGAGAGQVARAGKIFSSVLVGFVIAITAALVVDLILRTFTDQDLKVWTDFDPSKCEEPQAGGRLPPPPPPPPPPTGGTGQSTGGGTGGGTGALCPVTNNACSPQILELVGYTFNQARAMSCIAMTESGGVGSLINPNGGACGTFQILPSNWANRSLHQSPCSPATDCRDIGCNAQTAFLLSQGRIARGQSSYADWTCSGCNARAQNCVDRYDLGG